MEKILVADCPWGSVMADLTNPSLQRALKITECSYDKTGIHFRDTLTRDHYRIRLSTPMILDEVSMRYSLSGIVANEVVFVGNSYPQITSQASLYPRLRYVVDRYPWGNVYSDLLLQDIAHYLYSDRKIQVVNKYTSDAGCRGVFASAGFYYPASLFRRSHAQYFSDMYKPTPEEFLTALMIEGQYARSEEEETAIKEAEILVKRKGH